MRVIRKPDWLKKEIFNNSKENKIKNIIKKNSIHTVCQEARCPNIAECYSKNQATFLLLGNKCTRTCKFCNISTNNNKDLIIDLEEPKRVANSVYEMGLNYVVLTSVTRDDLDDGGASIFYETIKEIKKLNQNIKIEVLVPDFKANEKSIQIIANSDIVVFNHNLETVKRLYKFIRPEANYLRSIKVLELAKRFNNKLLIKTGIMVGLGEEKEEVIELMNDFYNTGGDILTIGQYLSPGINFYPVYRYVDLKEYEYYIEEGYKIGLKKIIASPFVRSSYRAGDLII